MNCKYKGDKTDSCCACKAKYRCYSGIGDFLTIQEEGKETPCVIIGEDGAGHQVQEHICKLLNENFPNGFPAIDDDFYNAGVKEVKKINPEVFGVEPKLEEVPVSTTLNTSSDKDPCETCYYNNNVYEDCPYCGNDFEGYKPKSEEVVKTCNNCKWGGTEQSYCLSPVECKTPLEQWQPIEPNKVVTKEEK